MLYQTFVVDCGELYPRWFGWLGGGIHAIEINLVNYFLFNASNWDLSVNFLDACVSLGTNRNLEVSLLKL